MINSLQSIRFVLALLIFHHHFFTNPEIGQFGTFPVVFFFILSGFLLSKGYAKLIIDESYPYKKFVIKRFIHIYPLNLIGLVLFFLYPIFLDIYHGEITAVNNPMLILDVLLLQSWFPSSSIYFSGNGVCWFLSDIVFCYLMFPAILKMRGKNHYFALFLMLVAYFMSACMMPEQYVHGLIYINPLFRVVDFCLGVELFFIYEKITISRVYELSVLSRTLVELLGMGLVVAFLLLFPYVSPRFSYASFYWMPSLCLILIFALHTKLGGVISRLLDNKYLYFLGKLSFPFYVFHNAIIWQYSHMENLLGFSGGLSVLDACVCILIILFISYLYVKYIEPVITNKLRNLCDI